MTADDSWLGELAGGSHVAFEQLFDAHADYVFNVALRRTGSVAVSEDIVGDVFLELWRQRHRIEAKYGSVRPWLAGTTANLARRYWRSATRQLRATARLQARGEPGDDFTEAAAARIDDARRCERLGAALSDLSPEHFDVLTLSVWEGLSHEEVAEALGVAVGTVKSRLSRARRRIERATGTGQAQRAWARDRPTGAVGLGPALGTEGGSA